MPGVFIKADDAGDNVDISNMIDRTAKYAKLGNADGESVTLNFEDLPPDIAENLKKIQQELAVAEKYRQNESRITALVIGLTTALVLIYRQYSKK